MAGVIHMRLLHAFHTCKVQIDQRIVENVDAYNFNPTQNCTWSNILCDIYISTQFAQDVSR